MIHALAVLATHVLAFVLDPVFDPTGGGWW
jgi:hypothetical protein